MPAVKITIPLEVIYSFMRKYYNYTRNNQFSQLLQQPEQKKEDSFRFRQNLELNYQRNLNLCIKSLGSSINCQIIAYKPRNSVKLVENKSESKKTSSRVKADLEAL